MVKGGVWLLMAKYYLNESPTENLNEDTLDYTHNNSLNRYVLTPEPEDDEEEKKESSLARNLMQAGIGVVEGAIYSNPYTATGAIGLDILAPAAAENELREQISSEADYPENIRKALGFKSPIGSSEIDYEIAKQGMKEAKEFALGQEESVGSAIGALPFRAAGIETAPKTGTEASTRFMADILTQLRKGGIFGELGKFPSAKPIMDLVQNLKKTNVFKKIEDLFTRGEKIPESYYEAAQDVAELLAKEELPKSLEGRVTPDGEPIQIKPLSPQRKSPSIQIPGEQTSPDFSSLQGRVTERGPRLRGQSREMQQTLEPIGRSISPVQFNNDEVAGNTFRQIPQAIAQVGRDRIADAYHVAENQYSTITDGFEPLIGQMQNLRHRLTQSGSPNSAEQVVIREIDNVLNLISSEGNARQVPVTRLIRTADSIAGRIANEAESIYGDARKLLNTVVHDINTAARQAVNRAGGNVEAIINADREYAQWANRFSNDEMAPYLTRGTFNSEGEYNKIINDRGTYRAMVNAIGDSPQGIAALDVVRRDIVEKQLEPYLKDISKIGSKEYEKTLKNLEPLIGEERVQQIDQRLSETRTRQTPRKMPRVKITPPRKPFEAKPRIGEGPKAAKEAFTNYQKQASEYIGKKPEDIQKMMNTRSGIKKLKDDLGKKEGGKELFENLSLSKLREIIPDQEYTGLKFFKVLNKNTELLSELFGKDLVTQAKREAFQEGKKILKRETIGKNIKRGAIAATGTGGLLKLWDLLYSSISKAE